MVRLVIKISKNEDASYDQSVGYRSNPSYFQDWMQEQGYPEGYYDAWKSWDSFWTDPDGYEYGDDEYPAYWDDFWGDWYEDDEWYDPR